MREFESDPSKADETVHFQLEIPDDPEFEPTDFPVDKALVDIIREQKPDEMPLSDAFRWIARQGIASKEAERTAAENEDIEVNGQIRCAGCDAFYPARATDDDELVPISGFDGGNCNECGSDGFEPVAPFE